MAGQHSHRPEVVHTGRGRAVSVSHCRESCEVGAVYEQAAPGEWRPVTAPVGGLPPELLAAMALRRALRGGVAQAGDFYVDDGFPMGHHLTATFTELIGGELLEVADESCGGSGSLAPGVPDMRRCAGCCGGIADEHTGWAAPGLGDLGGGSSGPCGHAGCDGSRTDNGRAAGGRVWRSSSPGGSVRAAAAPVPKLSGVGVSRAEAGQSVARRSARSAHGMAAVSGPYPSPLNVSPRWGRFRRGL
jgi:hypothetical protein